jgi:hypothetical protein
MKDLIGIGIAFVISAIALLGVFGPSAGLADKTRVQTTITDISALRNNLYAMYSTQQGGYGTSALPAAALINANAVPQDMINGTAINDAWQGAVTLTGATDHFLADLANVTPADCIGLATTIPPGGAIYQLAAAVNVAGLGAATPFAVPTDPGTANTNCASTTTAVRLLVK